jgi:light-regulated signal transduction histidine kinase (bacteriophytochrome)
MDNENCIVSCLTDITDRKNKELEIQKLNAELGKSIEQQKALNKELESFSYSVSHDLRAPLRSIDGYTRILQEDYGAKMDEEGHRIMKTIMNNAQKMNKLIDDLLSFSRLGKQSLDKVELDMNVIFSSIINDMKSHGPGEKTEFELKPLLNAWADRNLITQVIVNLLGNAIKYSSKKDHPRVEIGSYKEKDMHVYYIKDNGTGFDMAYYDKLFGIFQRLHSPSEFEGTGVGLAIVQRIVNRHQGRVWAEAVPDEGATFYFSLPIHT